jgi:beta-fructofuranosidase
MKKDLEISHNHWIFFPAVILCCIIMHLPASAQKAAQFSFEGTTGSTSVVDSISGSVFTIFNHFNRPERVTGVTGNALRLDGYSTWASNNNFHLNGITTKMTLEGWFAPEAFTKENAAMISQMDANSGFALSIGSFGNVILEFFADTKKYTFQTNQQVERYKWNHITATIDLYAQSARILVNGSEWGSYYLNSQSLITLSPATFYTGRHNNSTTYSGFLLTALNGAIDEVCVYSTVLTDSTIKAHYTAKSNLVPDLTIDPSVRYAGDYLRPQYHAMPNAAWTNEPYGLT